ncbi:MAG: erythromycin esterase [Mucilaginibacter sp.]|nr:erythromycin esterase [Mucilaginibacter sp.]
MVSMLLLSALMPLGLSAQSQNELITAINSQLVPLKSLSPGGDFNDLQPLKKFLKDKKVIGLGESAHGVHEFFTFKQRLLEFMVQEMGIKTLLTETDFTGTQVMNDYVTTGKGDVHEAMTALGGVVWTTQEFIDMAEWVKKYNSDKPDKDKVRIYGFDMTTSHNAVPLLMAYLTQTKQLTPELQQGFSALSKNVATLSDEDKLAINNALVQLRSVKFTRPDKKEAEFYKHTARTIVQYADYILPSEAPYPNQKNDIRDKYMAENAEWIYNYTGNSKMIISAHNEHLTKVINSTGVSRMGVYLNEKFKDNYYILAICFNNGRLRSIDSKNGGSSDFDVPAVTMANNSDALLALCNTPNFLLDFKTASVNPAIKAYLNQTITSYFIGSNYASKAGTDQMYIQHKWSEGYDAIVFIRNVSAATAVKSN